MWPLSPLTTYSPGGLPWVKADDLNLIQGSINDLYSGVKTVVCLGADGSGALGNTAISGTFRGGALVTRSTTPYNAGVPAGTLAQGTVPQGWAVVNGNGTFGRGFPVQSAGRTGGGSPSGDYTIVFNVSLLDYTNPGVFLAILENASSPTITAVPFLSGSQVSFRVRTANAGVLTDLKFSIGFFGE